MDPLYPLLFLVSLAGGFCQTALGFGYTVVVMLFLPMLLPSIPEAATVSCLTGVFCTIAIILQFRKAVRPKAVLWPIIAFFVMMPITGYLSLRIPQAGLELILGFFLIALGLYYMFFAKNLRIAPTPGAGILAGGVSGLFGGLFSVSAPPAALYCLSVLEDKDATEAQISGALTTLKSATAALAKAGDTGKPDDGDKPSAGKPNDKGDKGNGLSKTGASVAVIGVAMLLLAAAGFVTVNVVRRRR